MRRLDGPARRPVDPAEARCYHRAPCSITKRSSCSRRRSSTSSNAVAEPGVLDNVEDLLTDVITSPRFDSEVFTLERSLQVMLGPRAGTTLVGLLTVAPEVFDEVAEVRIPSEVHERLVAWRARFGLAIDNALNFLNNPDGIQGHNFATQIAHVEDRRVLQGRLTLVRYNNEPQFFVADASVFLGLVADIMERLGPYLEPDAVDAETLARLRDAIQLDRAQDRQPQLSGAARMRQVYLAATGQNRGKTTVSLGVLDGFQRRGLSTGFLKPVGQRTIIEDGVPADEDAVLMKQVFGLPEPLGQMSPVHIPRGFTQAYIEGEVVEDLPAPDPGRPRGIRRSRHPAHRGDRPRRGRRGDRAVERRRRQRCSARRRSSCREGGVGRPIDEIVLNASHVRALRRDGRRGDRQQGRPRRQARARPDASSAAWPATASRCSASCPYRPILSNPTLAMVLEGVHGETIHAGPDLDLVIGGIAIGAMEPEHMLERIGPRSLVIVPGDRRT